MFDVWQNVLAELKKQVSDDKFNTFLKNTSLLSNNNGDIEIGVANVFMQKNVRKLFNNNIIAALKNNNIEVKNINYIINTKSTIKKSHEVTNTERISRPQHISSINTSSYINNTPINTGLNSEYTLDNYVMGSNNELAVSVARAVIKEPGKKYNPFFLYGGSGLGKTHLIQAIGNELLKQNPKLKILYTPINHFYSDFINAISAQNKNKNIMDSFHQKYFKLDVLIVDDFQLIVGKEKSQEEFFNLFNDMQQMNKQIIVASDRLPSQIKTVDERLASRLIMSGAWDIEMPSFEDRCAILKSMAEFDGVDIENEAIEYIAENVKTNIRDLQGDYKRLIAMADIKNVTPLELIRNGFTQTSSSNNKSGNITPKKLIEKVAKYYNLSVDEMCSKSRIFNIKNARQVAMYLLSNECNLSTTKIATLVGVKDHTTVMHGIDKIKSDLKMNFTLRDEINSIREEISN